MEPTLVDRRTAEPRTVGEVMISRPKTMPHDATVGDLRAAFRKDTLRTVLLVDGDAFVATVERPDVPASAADGEPALAYARTDAERVQPGVTIREALPRLEASPEGRLVVVDEDGSTLRGLVCLKGTADAFCVDG